VVGLGNFFWTLWLGPFIDTIFYFALILFGLTGLVVFIIAIPTKWYIKLIPIPAYIILLAGSFSLGQFGSNLFFLLNKHTLETFINTIHNNPSIPTMSNLDRYSKKIGECYVASDSPIKTKEQLRSYFLNCIKLNHIDIDTAFAIKEKLDKLHFVSFYSTSSYILFTIDGMLDNEYGFLYLKDGLVPNVGENIAPHNFKVIQMNQITKHWYYWAST
jgi:energy-coupling factor transporter transmembrane protein EcfT